MFIKFAIFSLSLEVKQPSGVQQNPHLRTLVRVWISSSWAKTTPSTNTRTSGAEKSKCVSVCLLCDFYASLSVWETSKPKLSAFSLWQVSLSKRLNAFPIHEKNVEDSFCWCQAVPLKLLHREESFFKDDSSKLKHHMMIFGVIVFCCKCEGSETIWNFYLENQSWNIARISQVSSHNSQLFVLLFAVFLLPASTWRPAVTVNTGMLGDLLQSPRQCTVHQLPVNTVQCTKQSSHFRCRLFNVNCGAVP